jgi:hypothetical protein
MLIPQTYERVLGDIVRCPALGATDLHLSFFFSLERKPAGNPTEGASRLLPGVTFHIFVNAAEIVHSETLMS